MKKSKNRLHVLFLFVLVFPIISCAKENKVIHNVLLNEKTPIRPGNPLTNVPFWNEKAVQFLYPPAFEVAEYSDAVSYQFILVSQQKNDSVIFTAKYPWESLSPIWNELPSGKHDLTINALDKDGKVVETIFERTFHRAAKFQGNNVEPSISLDESIRMGLDALIHADELKCWFTEEGIPDTTYLLYRYPSKMVGAAASALALYSMQEPRPADATDALKAAKRAADHLLSVSFKENEYWAYHPYTYHPVLFKNALKHFKINRYMTHYGALAGNYYLDVYRASNEKKYLDAALNIADTYLKNQLSNGTWYLYMNGQTGELAANNYLIPTLVMLFLEDISDITGKRKYARSAKKALDWISENPVKTWNWQGQFEDVAPQDPYQNLTHIEAGEFAVYLFEQYPHDKLKVELGIDLLRFTEDQFVIWDNPPVDNPAAQNPDGAASAQVVRWLLPCVLEQYRCYAPVTGSSARFINTLLAAYNVTGEEQLVEKAHALANVIINQQNSPNSNGRFQTWQRNNKGPMWFNAELQVMKAFMQLRDVK